MISSLRIARLGWLLLAMATVSMGCSESPVPVDAEVPANACAPGACGGECFRAVSCVRECAGTEVGCGCCSCNTGWIDTIDCPSP